MFANIRQNRKVRGDTINYTVYMHVCPNKKRYIGITKQRIEKRWKNGKGYKNNEHFYNAIIKYGWGNIEHIIISQNLNEENACKLEQELIKKYNTTNRENGYNNSIGGEHGTLGIKMSEEQKEKLRQANLGKHHSVETRRKMSEAHLINYSSEEYREKVRQAHIGRIMSKETREKIRQTRLGKPLSEEAKIKKSKPVMCIETGKVYYGMTEASKQTNTCLGSIYKCCNGQRHTAGGYHWEYV